MNRNFKLFFLFFLCFLLLCCASSKGKEKVVRKVASDADNSLKNGYYNVRFHSLEEFANYDPENYPPDVSVKIQKEGEERVRREREENKKK